MKHRYYTAVSSLCDYYHPILFGIVAYFKAKKIEGVSEKTAANRNRVLFSEVRRRDFSDQMAAKFNLNLPETHKLHSIMSVIFEERSADYLFAGHALTVLELPIKPKTAIDA